MYNDEMDDHFTWAFTSKLPPLCLLLSAFNLTFTLMSAWTSFMNDQPR